MNWDFMLILHLHLSVVACIFLMFLFILYFRSYKSISNRCVMNVMNLQPSMQQNSGRGNAAKVFAKAVLLILGSLFICYAPFMVCRPLAWLYGSFKWLIFMAYLTQLIVTANSTVNAVVVLVLDRDINRYVKSLFSSAS